MYPRGSVTSPKGDNRVWCSTRRDRRDPLDFASRKPVSRGVQTDDLAVRDVYVAEDGGNLEIVSLRRAASTVPLVASSGIGQRDHGPRLTPTAAAYSARPQTPGTTYEYRGLRLAEGVPSLSGPWGCCCWGARRGGVTRASAPTGTPPLGVRNSELVSRPLNLRRAARLGARPGIARVAAVLRQVPAVAAHDKPCIHPPWMRLVLGLEHLEYSRY